jgi:hypothetical protein
MHYILGQKDRKLGVLYYKQLKSYFHKLQRLFTHAIAIMQYILGQKDRKLGVLYYKQQINVIFTSCKDFLHTRLQ